MAAASKVFSTREDDILKSDEMNLTYPSHPCQLNPELQFYNYQYLGLTYTSNFTDVDLSRNCKI